MSDATTPGAGDHPGAPWASPAPPDGGPPGPDLLPSSGRRRLAGLVSAPPRHLVALALVVAGALAVVAALAPVLLGPGAGGGGVVARLQAGTSVVGLAVVLLVPAALVLVADVAPASRRAGGAADLAVVGAFGVGASASVLALVALVTDLVDGALPGSTRVVALLLDLAVLAVAATSTWWAASSRAPAAPAPAPPAAEGVERPATGHDRLVRPADPGWGLQPPVWPTRPPTEPPTEG